ncbi:MAG: hypothetical protein GYA36_19805 [Veillonellaceae bacterium]|nr:hypothetical protein [Veillonellaceae bacterium]
MRRSPAEYYIRYRLITDRTKSTDDIAKDLADELVFAPNKKYLEEMRQRIVVPSLFRPKDLRDLVTQTFLRSQGVWTMFHQPSATLEALNVFGDMGARSLLQALIAGPHADQVVLDVFRKRAAMPLSEAGLAEFKHYFWNLKLLTLEELADYVAAFLHDRTLLRILRLPKSPANMFVSMYKLGIHPKELDEAENYKTFQIMFMADALETSQTMECGLPRATATKMLFEGYDLAREKREALAISRGDITDRLLAAVAASRDMEGTTLIDLQQGKPPTPVGLLPKEQGDIDLEDEEETANG